MLVCEKRKQTRKAAPGIIALKVLKKETELAEMWTLNKDQQINVLEFTFKYQVWVMYMGQCNMRYTKTGDTAAMTLISRSRLIWAQCEAVINSHTAAERFVPWNWIVLLSDKRKTMFVDACVNTRCRGVPFSSPPQNEIPPYESRITTAKLLIESEEYEVKCLSCVVLARSVVVSLCMFRGGRAAWHLYVCVCVLCFAF